ncbi:carbonic anhydrase 1-like [Pseudomyrmex gracilis]|uniref:carbonic anhydrase 1-like n=1 Tax=Pseudomyrmex gracilis TaxID=219809 RepID=UPI0009956C8A|nr:carbonic anhydrase 1-like [Pseudomyrmex gracilis]
MSSSIDDNVNIEDTVRFINQLATSDGSLKSPINLNISDMKVVELNPVEWFNYDSTPKKLKLTNTGRTVLLSATWQAERPYLRGGPFVSSYKFSQIHFHWGKTDMNGSEHYVDGGSVPMEMHAVHFKSDYETHEAALRKDDGISILVYFLQLQAAPNPFLDDIIRALPFIQTVHSSVRLISFPLTNLLRSFQRDYFVYWGSVMLTNIRNSILWLITREPIGISLEQVAKFRTVQDERGVPILTNRQALQDRGGRNIFFVCPSGSTYATLLPIRHVFRTEIQEENDGKEK